MQSYNIPSLSANLAKLTELSKLLSVKSDTNESIVSLIGYFNLGKVLSHHRLNKMRGVEMVQLVLSLMLFRINGQTIGALSAKKFHGLLETGKNCYYRLMNRSRMDWRAVLLSMACRFGAIIRKYKAEETEAPQCYIVDDTTNEKTGFHIEGLSRVFDHVRRICVPGFKLLVLAIFDGRSTYACDLSLHREKGREKNYGLSEEERAAQSHKKRSKNDPDYARYKELDSKKNDNAIEMIKRAWRRGIRLPYALMDTWFISSGLVAELRKIGSGAIHLVGRLKMGTERYRDGNRMHNVHELILLHGREAMVCRNYKCMWFSRRVYMGDTPVKLFFVKVGRSNNWNVIITTDMSMKFIRAFEIYQIRWNIEVLFKECRQYLGLGGYQGTDFDAQIADCTLCFMTHMVLTLGKRFGDYETLGELFREERASLLMLTLWKRILSILERLMNVLSKYLVIDVWETMAQITSAVDGSETDKILFILSLLESPEHTQENPTSFLGFVD